MTRHSHITENIDTYLQYEGIKEYHCLADQERDLLIKLLHAEASS